MFKLSMFRIGCFLVHFSHTLSGYLSNKGWSYVARYAPSEQHVSVFAKEYFSKLGYNVTVVGANEFPEGGLLSTTPSDMSVLN